MLQGDKYQLSYIHCQDYKQEIAPSTSKPALFDWHVMIEESVLVIQAGVS